jgi:phosphate starvation-inducible PhoH-like protein
MKMFLSRMGEHSRMVVTGDPEQSDLPREQISGLREALDLLQSMEGVAITTFDNRDVVRHKLVGRILKAYEKAGHGANV